MDVALLGNWGGYCATEAKHEMNGAWSGKTINGIPKIMSGTPITKHS